jgi:hypothetical protein
LDCIGYDMSQITSLGDFFSHVVLKIAPLLHLSVFSKYIPSNIATEQASPSIWTKAQLSCLVYAGQNVSTGLPFPLVSSIPLASPSTCHIKSSSPLHPQPPNRPIHRPHPPPQIHLILTPRHLSTFFRQHTFIRPRHRLPFRLREARRALVRGVRAVEFVDDGMDHDGLFGDG